jgi:hypothetical protein
MRLGMPPPPRAGGPPVTNILNTSSPHWRMWLKPDNRCLVPANGPVKGSPGDQIWRLLIARVDIRFRWRAIEQAVGGFVLPAS